MSNATGNAPAASQATHTTGPSRRAADIALASSCLFIVLLAAMHLLRPDLDPSWRFVSEYEIGAHGWIMRVAFLSLAVGTVALGVALRSSLRTIPGYVGLAMLAVTAAGLALAGLFVSDPITATALTRTSAGRVHELGAMLDLVPYAAPFINLSLARNAAWSNSRALLRWTAWLPLLGLAVFGGAMAAMLPAEGQTFGPEVQVGWPNRFFLLTQCAWMMVLAAIAASRPAHRR